MHFPLNINLFGREVSTHLVCELLAIFVGVRIYTFLRKRIQDPISNLNRLYIFAAVCFGALIGSRLVGVLENPTAFITSTSKFAFIFSNKTILGGLLGGLLAVEGIKKILGITHSSGDIMVYPILIGLIIGRIGCFCEGLADGTTGRSTQFFAGVDFGDGVYRHPLALYEILYCLLCIIGIYLLERKIKLSDGARFKIFLLSYFIYRFSVEALKENNYTLLGLSTLQITSGLGIIYYYKVILSPKSLILKYAGT